MLLCSSATGKVGGVTIALACAQSPLVEPMCAFFGRMVGIIWNDNVSSHTQTYIYI